MATAKITVELDRLDLRNADSDPVKGRYVDNLQGLLVGTRRAEFQSLAIDGIAGPKTKQATGEFQQKNGLTKDYLVGPLTWEKLIEF